MLLPPPIGLRGLEKIPVQLYQWLVTETASVRQEGLKSERDSGWRWCLLQRLGQRTQEYLKLASHNSLSQANSPREIGAQAMLNYKERVLYDTWAFYLSLLWLRW